MASSVDIAPTLGHAPDLSQVGPSAGWDAIDIRRLATGALQEGVIEAGAYEVTQKAAGANMSVDVAASTGGAFIDGDAVTGQGRYFLPRHTGVINVDIAAAHATLPRVDMVVLEVKDDTHDAGGLNVARVRVVSGTATAAATLDNRNGAAALPDSALLLADVHVPATDTTIGNAQIRDRRLWARGAFVRLVNTTVSPSTTSGTPAAIHASMKARIECSGAPVRLSLMGRLTESADATATLQPTMDGAAIDTNVGYQVPIAGGYGLGDHAVSLSHVFTPTAGSHLLEWYWSVDAGTLTLFVSASSPAIVVVEELVRQNTVNNATTSG